ncbi:hypothetical protein [Schlesneria paludicola]|uniref:hypothetical protein n=1 Tax=Schlesneria paludicola TaxID=360056 RepID=UPI00029AD541|nr:hypothetical protein [Schlesneria paludicola]
MQIVAERVMAPRPLQRPSDVERRPIDFGIEAPPPAPVKPEATIIKSAVDRETIQALEVTVIESKTQTTIVESISEVTIEPKRDVTTEDDWGDGIL